MSFGSRLRQKRKEMGLKQSELGELLGVTGSAIGNYENNLSSPKAEILYKAFDVLHCDANFLFQDEMAELKKSSISARAEMEDDLSDIDKTILTLFDSLNAENRQKILEIARLYAESQQSKKD